jgi:G3E family GTPase
MNIAYTESPTYVEAKTCGCREKGIKIAYSFVDTYHSLCLDKKDIIMAQIDACERLLINMTDKISDSAITKEIAELKMALDLLP